MDIIPVAPAPQQNASSAQTATDAAGKGSDSGFGLLLGQAVSSDSARQQTPTHAGGSGQKPTDLNTGRATKTPIENPVEPIGDEIPVAAGTGDEDSSVISALGIAMPIDQGLLTLLFGNRVDLSGVQMRADLLQASSGQPLNPLLQALLTPEGKTIELPRIGENALTITVENGAGGVPLPATGKHMDALLTQLQALISRAQDHVSVTASFQPEQRATLPGYLSGPLISELSAAPVNTQSQQAITATVLTAEQQVIVAPAPAVQTRTEPGAPTLRQEQAAHDLNARLAVLQNNSQEQKSETGGQQNAMHQQTTTGQHAGTTLTPQVDANTTSHGFTAQFQEAASLQPDASRLSGQPSSLPPGQQLLENEVLQQIVQRFSLHTNLQTSKLSLKLHPAELGELKINIVVKEDSLKANIYAQTRQAQEIIEKHLPRLKAILEEQGLVVEDLIVTLESEFLEDSTSQQSQSFAQQMSDFHRDQRPGGTHLFRQSPDEDLLPASEREPHEPSGVNLTV
ncbi:MAG: flagellar hook-length control protein FliK [Desulfofustis sp.]|nr:flagellar hook-length control protein FliK [Desulfofustis sp.]